LRKQLERTVSTVGLELSVLLGGAQVSVRQLLGLKPGDVVPLDRRVGEPQVAPVQGRPKFSGHVGLLGNRVAFKVAGTLAKNA
jgi:flagellar motor switch protein FliM